MSGSIRHVDHGKARILRELQTRLVGKVGFPYEKNPLHEQSHIKLAEIAVVHEYGLASRNIPSRPFMRETGKRERKTAAKLYKILYHRMLIGEITKHQLLAQMGIWYASEMKETITQHGPGLFVPNSPATIARKHSSTPLLDTAGMKNGITSVVTSPEAIK